MGPSLAELCIEQTGTVLAAYICAAGLPQNKPGMPKVMAGGGLALLAGAAAGLISYTLGIGGVVINIVSLFLIVRYLYGCTLKKSLTVTLVTLGIGYAVYYAAFALMVFVVFLNKTAVSGRFEKSVDAWIYIVRYLTTFWGGILFRAFVFVIQLTLLVILMNTRLFKRLLNWLMNIRKIGVLVYLWFAVLSVRLLDLFSVNTRHDIVAVAIVCVFLMIILCFQMYFWGIRQLSSSYRADVLESELAIVEKSLTEKDEFIGDLREDNMRLAAIIHKDNKLIPSMVMSLRNPSGNADSASSLKEAADVLGGIYAQRAEAVSLHRGVRMNIRRTGVTSTDAVLLCLSRHAKASCVDFRCDIRSGLNGPQEDSLKRCEINVVLAGLSASAVASAEKAGGGAVRVNIFERGESRCIEVMDSGGRMSVRKLRRACKGKLRFPHSVRKCEISARTVGRIIRYNRASIEIEELSGEVYSKAVRVIFDGAGERRIITDRAGQLRKELGTDRAVIEDRKITGGEHEA